MSIDRYRLLTNLLDAFDRFHDGMIEVTDVAALLFATSRALATWPYVDELVAVEKQVRHLAESGGPADHSSQVSDLLQPLRERIAGELAALDRKPRHDSDAAREQ
ncbi:hypothetical protein [Actinoplanes sp. M2I2]|uniref:hypothetical protein n=1 Tax=Actinoplanes sp. M2I2 TaxID=1734444 RepID=UPI0020218D7F|nr:hypothetical protein [Actinoplanes sp. M2I2]